MGATKYLLAALAALAAAVLSPLALQSMPLDTAQIRGSKVMITGASQGLGRELALEYAKLGATVVLVARNEARLQQVASECRELGGEAHVVAAALGDDAVAAQVVARGRELVGSIDTLVLNHVTGDLFVPGGWSSRKDMPLVRKTLEINTFSYIALAMEAMPVRRLVVVSSMTGVMGMPKLGAYSASKHALHGWFGSLRHDLKLAGSNTTVTTAVIGSLDTESNRAIEGLERFKDQRYPPSRAALAILRGGELGVRDVFFPIEQAYVMALLQALCPALTDFIVQRLNA